MADSDAGPARILPPMLPDPWDRDGAVRLDGVLERRRQSGSRAAFWRVFEAFFVLLSAFIFFQVISSTVAVMAIMASGVPSAEILTALTENVGEHARSLLVGNTFGQFLGLALPAVLLVGLHSSERWAFLRLRPADGGFVGLSVLGLVALVPVVQWLGNVNSDLPLPEWVRVFEESQMELIEQVLMTDTGFIFNLFVLAITPAICEEVLFRGYVQRQAERGLGVVGGIVFSGVLFGLYHLRLTQAIPLTVLGLYLAYLTWRTGSLWPAIVVHFLNNALAVVVGAYVASDPELDMADVEQVDVPWYLVAVGFALFLGVVAVLHRYARARLAEQPAAAMPGTMHGTMHGEEDAVG